VISELQITPGPSMHAPGKARGWWTASVLAFAGLVSYTDRLILSALVDPITHSLQISDAQFSFVQGTAFSICCVVSGLLLGRLVDTRNRVRILFVAALVWCTGTLLAAASQNFWHLAMARAFVGIGEGALAPGAVSLIADSFSETRRGAPLGLFFMGLTVGGPTSIAIGSLALSFATAGGFSAVPVLNALTPWRAALAAVAMTGFLVPALIVTLREPVRSVRPESHNTRQALRILLSQRRSLVPVYLAMALLAVGDFATLSWVPTLLTRRFDMSLAQLGVSFGLITGVAAAVACLLGGLASDRASRYRGVAGRPMISAVFVLLAGCGALLICANSANWVLAGIGLWTLGAQTAAVSALAFLQAVAAAEVRGLAIAIAAFFTLLLGFGAGPPLIAVVTDHVYHDPLKLGLAISTTAIPAAALALAMFILSIRAASRSVNPRNVIHV
jgi:predicted MFS family arabinose efflux permease